MNLWVTSWPGTWLVFSKSLSAAPADLSLFSSTSYSCFFLEDLKPINTVKQNKKFSADIICLRSWGCIWSQWQTCDPLCVCLWLNPHSSGASLVWGSGELWTMYSLTLCLQVLYVLSWVGYPLSFLPLLKMSVILHPWCLKALTPL